MCIANYEASGSQVQLTLERGLPAMLGSFTSKQLPYPSLSYDMVHCARCGVDWDSKGTLKASFHDIDGCYSLMLIDFIKRTNSVFENIIDSIYRVALCGQLCPIFVYILTRKLLNLFLFSNRW